MNLLVLGASQGTGALVVRAALDKGHAVTAFARSPQKLTLEHPKLTKRTGDFHQRESVEAAVPGHDAVIVTASASSLRAFRDNPRYFSQGTEYAIEAMQRSGVKRLVILSALGVGDSRMLLNPILRVIFTRWLLKTIFEDHGRQEDLARASKLDWVSVRPGRLTNGPARHRYKVATGDDRVPSSISRADLADFLVRACEESTWLRQAVQVGG